LQYLAIFDLSGFLMVLVIDAYNVLKSRGDLPGSHIQRVRWFVSIVEAYVREKKHTAVIVFDGGSASFPTRTAGKLVDIVHSGYKISADDVIKKVLLEYPPEKILLVSSDRELVDCAERLSIVTLQAIAFYDLLCATERPAVKHCAHNAQVSGQPHRKPPATVARKRVGHVSSSEVDALMEQESVKIYHKDVQHESRDVGGQPGGKKLGKHERRLHRVVKKL
jgi:hypothetical protein